MRRLLLAPVAVVFALAACSGGGVEPAAVPDEELFVQLMELEGYATSLMPAADQLEAGYRICEGAAENGEPASAYAERVGSLMDDKDAEAWYVTTGLAAEAALCPA